MTHRSRWAGAASAGAACAGAAAARAARRSPRARARRRPCARARRAPAPCCSCCRRRPSRAPGTGIARSLGNSRSILECITSCTDSLLEAFSAKRTWRLIQSDRVTKILRDADRDWSSPWQRGDRLVAAIVGYRDEPYLSEASWKLRIIVYMLSDTL